MDNKKITVIGGDLRQLVVAREFASQGFCVSVYAFDSYTEDISDLNVSGALKEAVTGADFIVLPLPVSVDKYHISTPLSKIEVMCEDVLEMINENQILLGGMLNDNIKNRHINSFDYYDREELKILNAIPTAEGAIAIAMDELPITLHNSNISVLGYGRIGKILANMLRGLGANVTICARKESDLALAVSYGYKGVNMSSISEALKGADVIFNTVPAKVIKEPYFDDISKDALIVDLATRPGGVDFDMAKQKGLKVIWALSLPGKVAPVTAGQIIFKTIQNILKQEGAL